MKHTRIAELEAKLTALNGEGRLVVDSMKLPIAIESDPGMDWGWRFVYSDGTTADPDDVVKAINYLGALVKSSFDRTS